MGIFERQARLAQDLAAKQDLAGALQAIDRAAAEAVQALVFRARLLDALGRPDEALGGLCGIDALPASAATLEFRADLEMRLDRFEAAEATLDKALARARGGAADRARLLARRAEVFRVTGRFDRAAEDYEAAIALSPGDGELHRLRGDLSDAAPGDGTVARLRGLLAAVQPGSRAEVHFGFALAKALDDTGDHAGAAEAYLRANAAMRKRHPYDVAQRLALVEAACNAFGDVTPERVAVPGASEAAPIFVTGLPRSGTTLIEQILSAHPEVRAAGETGLFSQAATTILGRPEAPPPDGLDLSPGALAWLGQVYVGRLTAQHGAAPRHTDKSLQTLLVAGPALTALPRAQIVVVRRDPRATALSLFRQVFREGRQLYSYDLDDIDVYQRSFERLVSFWATRLPERFHVIDYEDVVTAPERAIPDLLDRVGLPFDPACLAPETSDRPVKTLSAVAVRRPITADALAAWAPYESLLGLGRFAR